MHVAVCTIALFMPHVHSLKERRQIVSSLIQRIRAKVNASVAETGFQNCWQRAEIGVAMVSSDRGLLDKEINLIRNVADQCYQAETVEFIVDYV